MNDIRRPFRMRRLPARYTAVVMPLVLSAGRVFSLLSAIFAVKFQWFRFLDVADRKQEFRPRISRINTDKTRTSKQLATDKHGWKTDPQFSVFNPWLVFIRGSNTSGHPLPPTETIGVRGRIPREKVGFSSLLANHWRKGGGIGPCRSANRANLIDALECH